MSHVRLFSVTWVKLNFHMQKVNVLHLYPKVFTLPYLTFKNVLCLTERLKEPDACGVGWAEGEVGNFRLFQP